LTVSSIQIIHAAEMQGISEMQIHNQGNKTMTLKDESIFCDLWDKKNTQCNKEVLPDKYAQNQEKHNLNQNILVSFYFILQEDVFLKDKEVLNWINDPPWVVFQKSKYINLVWIVKNLN